MSNDADELAAIAQRYERFATVEARGASPIYETLAHAIAASVELLAFLSSVPADRRQPNLFLAAVRHVAGVPATQSELEAIIRSQGARVRDLMLSRTTQTNEPARCAVLLPILASLRQPLALIEVGASAGLCLIPERYGYDYSGHRLTPGSSGAIAAPVFACAANASTPLPVSLPEIVWRCGLDLNPLDLHSASDMAWLETLVWPGQERRADQLRAAIEVARLEPPKVHLGNLLSDLPAIARLAPANAQLVIFHSAVLAYLASQSDRDQFASIVRRIGAVWICNEAPSVYPEIARSAPQPPNPGQFLLAVDGRPVAWAGPHGQSLEWFAE
jgi:hypothetical protein